MAKKIGFLLGVGVGYVLGARAGRQRYDQIVTKVRGVASDPRVQEKASQAQHLAQEKAGQAAQAVKGKAEDASAAATEKVKEKVQERKQESGDTDDSGDAGPSGDGSAPTPHDMPETGTPLNSPSAKLPPHPVAQPGTPGGTAS